MTGTQSTPHPIQLFPGYPVSLSHICSDEKVAEEDSVSVSATEPLKSRDLFSEEYVTYKYNGTSY